MAVLRPLRALHYDPAILADVLAPPYDVIDAPMRARLAARSPHNVVAIDLPEHGDYAGAARTLAEWRASGVLTRDPEPALWVLAQDYTGPDGTRRTRTGVLGHVEVQEYGPGRIRPHERTHSGPKEDRLALTRATNAQLSPIFSLYGDPAGRARAALARLTAAPAWGEATDEDGTTNHVWRVTDASAIAELTAALAPAELLIADGHHRYETARASGQPHVLMCLVALEDPGLTVFPTHRLARGRGQERYEALAATLKGDFAVEEVPLDELAPPAGATEHAQFGYVDAHFRRGFRLTRRAAPADDPLERLDTVVLERELLKGPLGLTDDDIDHLDGFGYARDAAEAIALVTSGAYDVAFLLRPTPVAQIRAVADTGRTMPPKSTYFFPKIPTGLLISPFD